jgi:hypothetical protein
MYTFNKEVRSLETNKGWFYYEETRRDALGALLSRKILAWNGRDSWKLEGRAAEQEQLLANGETGGEYLSQFERLGVGRKLLGEYVHPKLDPFFSEVIHDHARVERAVVDGAAYVKTEWKNPTDETTSVECQWDPAHGFVLRDYREFRQVGGKERPLVEWRVTELARASNPDASGSPAEYWYPKKTSMRLLTEESGVLFDDVLIIIEVRVNPVLSIADFTPRIEDGSTILDRRNGRVVVHGGGPSERLKEIVKKRVEDTREELKVLKNAGLVARTQSPPWGWSAYIPYAAVILAICCLAFAVWRSRSGQ